MQNRILIIRIGALGDVLRITPIVHTLNDNNFKVDVITTGVGKILFQNNPYINNVYVLNSKKNFIRILKLKKQLLEFNYEYIINYENLKNINKFCLNLNYNNYINPVMFDFKQDEINVNDYYYEYIKPVLKNIEFKKYHNEIYPSEKDKNVVEKFLNDYKQHKFKIGIHIGSSKTNRRWNKNFKDVRLWGTENYINLIKELIKLDCYIFLTGSKNENDTDESVINQINNEKLINVDFNIQQLYYFITKLNWFISGDTGPAHMAAGTEVKQICLCGATDGKISAPKPKKNYYLIQKNPKDCPPCYDYDKRRRDKCKNNICMSNIVPKDILNIILENSDF